MGDSGIQSQQIAWQKERLRNGLSRLVPASLTEAGLPPRRVRSVLISSFPIDPPAKAALTVAADRGSSVELRLSPDLFLKRSVDLPAAARQDAASAIALLMRQSMPGQAEGLIWRHAYAPGGTGPVQIYVLKTARLAEILQDAGVPVRRVTIDGVQTVPLVDNRAATDRPERFWNRAATLLTVLALVTVFGAQEWTLSGVTQTVADETARVADLRDKAASARAAAETRGAETSARLTDLLRLEQDSSRLGLIADLTRVLDDSVWLSTFALDGSTLRLTGTSQQEIAPVIAAIRPLAWAGSVDLDGAVLVDSVTGERRFQLIIALRPQDGLQ